MSTTERRAGQRWRCVSPSGLVDEGTIDGVMTGIGTWRMLGAKEDYWSDSYRWGGRNGFEMTLLSDIPAPQPKPACGAPEWCGLRYSDPKVPYFPTENDAQGRIADAEHFDEGVICFCSSTCQARVLAARVPPLESKPAETGKTKHHAFDLNLPTGKADLDLCDCGLIRRHPVHYPAPPAQEAPKAEPMACKGGCGLTIVPATGAINWKCAKCCEADCEDCRTEGSGKVRIVGRIMGAGRRLHICDGCYLAREEKFAEKMMFESSGTPYAGPERLPKAKLAHSHGVEDPALEDAP